MMSNYYFPYFTLIDKYHPLHLKKVDISIEDGKIADIQPSKQKSSTSSEFFVSMGWFDMICNSTVPGYEYKDTLSTLACSALYGGYTDICLLPNGYPPIENVENISWLQEKAKNEPVTFHFLARPTQVKNKKQLTNILDISQQGALGFTEEHQQNSDEKIVLRLLEYISQTNKPLIAFPDFLLLTKPYGDVHEGIKSIEYGLTGIPTTAEMISIRKYIHLFDYQNCKLHISHISTAAGIEILKGAKKKNTLISCDVAAPQLIFSDEDIKNYDTLMKVLPPFRERENINDLWKGIENDVIDVIVSSHQPQSIDDKRVPFQEAKFGMLSLETLFASVMTYKPKFIGIEKIIEKIATHPRKLLGKRYTIKEGEPACLTFFDPHHRWRFTEKHIHSLSKNTPFLNHEFRGIATAVFHNNTYHQLIEKKE